MKRYFHFDSDKRDSILILWRVQKAWRSSRLPATQCPQSRRSFEEIIPRNSLFETKLFSNKDIYVREGNILVQSERNHQQFIRRKLTLELPKWSK